MQTAITSLDMFMNENTARKTKHRICQNMHSLQCLVEATSKCQALKAGWQVHSLQCLVEATSKRLALKAGWQVHSLKCLVEATSKCQALKAGWQAQKNYTCED